MIEDEKLAQLTDKLTNDLLPGIVQIIDTSRQKAAVFLNAEITLMYWSIGNYINQNLKENNRTEYGSKIVATLSQLLSWSIPRINDNKEV